MTTENQVEVEVEVTEASPVDTIEQLQARIEVLEAALEANNNVVLTLQRQIVEVTAAHIDRIFNDDVMIDSVAQRILIAGANAIAFKAKASRNRAPELVVIEGYLPGAIKASIDEEGSVTIEMEERNNPGVWLSGAALPEQYNAAATLAVFGDLLISYGAEQNKAYYIIERRDMEEAREKASSQALEIAKSVEGVAAATTEQ